MAQTSLLSENKTNDTDSMQFKADVLKGLTSFPKVLQSKYFYDDNGDELFQRIMHSPEYYLTNCELEILQTKCTELRDIFSRYNNGFDLIELGAGDAFKSQHLLKCLANAEINYTYYPIDISGHVIDFLENDLPLKIPGLKIKGLKGEYFDMLNEATHLSSKPKIVLLLGANIGNMPPADAEDFCKKLRKCLSKGDMMVIGFDLTKNPWDIFNAYNDQGEATKDFNLNLLQRINRELGADFDLDKFDHYESYDPETGACKSYLISLADQSVEIDGKQIPFSENEYIYTETSHKYTLQQTDEFAEKSGFTIITHLFDSKKWFTDVVWECI